MSHRRRASAVFGAARELQSLGLTDLRTGGSRGAWKLIFGEWAELGEGTMKVELLACPQCRRLELRLPEQG